MTAGLKSNEDISQGVRRIAKKQASVITKYLKRKRIHRELDAVHQARKHIKKLRALLRLVREGLGRKLYHREKAGLRKLNGALSPVREATVHLKNAGFIAPGLSQRFVEKQFRQFKAGFIADQNPANPGIKDIQVFGPGKNPADKIQGGRLEIGKNQRPEPLVWN